jgi:N-acyl-D-aspartate/D-glutamate deacylase
MATPLDLVIRNAVIVDGARSARYRGDIAVRDGLIPAIGTVGHPPCAAGDVSLFQRKEFL